MRIGFEQLIDIGKKVSGIAGEHGMRDCELVIRADARSVRKIDEDIHYRSIPAEERKNVKPYTSDADSVRMKFDFCTIYIVREPEEGEE